jgi:hypothetical protein
MDAPDEARIPFQGSRAGDGLLLEGHAMRTEWSFGRHQARFAPPDLLWVRFNGPTSFEEAKASVDICQEVGSVQPFFLLIDVGESTIDAKSRDYIVQSLKQEWFRGIIYIGLGMVQRAMAKALVVALYFTRWRVDIDFVATEQDALALLAKKREKRGTRAA